MCLDFYNTNIKAFTVWDIHHYLGKGSLQATAFLKLSERGSLLLHSILIYLHRLFHP